MTAAIMISLLSVCVGWIIYDQTRNGKDAFIVDIPKTRCVEICTETLMKRGVFPPDFHDTVQQCDEVFAHQDTCELRSKR